MRVTSRSWLHALGAGVDAVLLPVSVALSVWHEEDIARETEYVVDDETLGEIDRRLCDYFSLTPPDPQAGE